MVAMRDMSVFLDDLLRDEPNVEYKRQATRTERECVVIGEIGEKYVHCIDVAVPYTEKYSDHARVSRTEIVEVSKLTYFEEKIKQFPERVRLQRQRYFNCDDVQSSINLAMTVSGTRSSSVSFSNSISTTTSFGLSMSFSGKFGSLGTTMGFSRTIQMGSQNSDGESETVTRSISANVSMAPNRSGIATLMVYETEIEVPFEAEVVLDGVLVENESNLSRASQLLDLAKRTVKIQGSLRIQDVSEGVFKTEKLPGNCSNGEGDAFPSVDTRNFEFIAGDNSAAGVSGFAALKDAMNEVKLFADEANIYTYTPGSFEKSSTIGPIPDGVHYTIIYARSVMRPSALCGFNDIGVPINATFQIEGRQYYQYSNGMQVRTWFDEEEIFSGCVSP